MINFPDPEIAFCPAHIEPFRARWPKGYAPLIVRMLYVVTEDPRFYANFQKNAEGKLVLDEEIATAKLFEHSPLCCFLGDERMTMLTNEALNFGEAKS